MLVRKALVSDTEPIAVLMHQLGYDVGPDVLAERLGRRGDRREVLVAVSDDGKVTGWVGICIDEPFVEGFGAHIEGLVVDETSRSRGVGERLIAAAESWARESGCREMRVHSNVIRTRAHGFYARNGYAAIKAQHLLRKPL